MNKLYEGNAIKTKEDAEDYNVAPYLPSDELIQAVQLAQRLGRPLLVKGEPGCGKSRLAEAIAVELHGEHYEDYYFQWNIKSSSKAVDGLYTIDHLKRLRDANSGTKSKKLTIALDQDENGLYKIKGNYISLNVLGRAFQSTHTPKLENAPVVLIDEIDKADIDFPNDLLYELDKMAFNIPDVIGKDGLEVSISAADNLKPIVIITSNDEKPLPAAFLRRCLFYYIDIETLDLAAIVNAKFPRLAAEEGLVADAVERFKSWRRKIRENGVTPKNITTSELLDWIKLLQQDVEKGIRPVFNDTGLPPNFQALLKDLETLQLFAK
jgi:MoxR-like ATPase